MAQAANGRAAGAPAEGEVVTEGAVLLTAAAGVLLTCYPTTRRMRL